MAVETPECDKMLAVHEQSQAIGEFLDTSGFRLCRWRAAGNTGVSRYLWRSGVVECKQQRKPIEGREPDNFDYFNHDATDNPEYEEWEDGYVPVHEPINQILADYFEIDLAKVDEERRAVLEDIRGERKEA